MTARRFVLLEILALAMLVTPPFVGAQQTRLYRIGVVLQGGPQHRAVDGMRRGLRELGFEEGKHYVFHLREARGDLKAVEVAAAALEAEKVDLIYTVSTSVTLAAKRATKNVPMVFYAGTDPVTMGLVSSYAKPGGRLTGVHGQHVDLTGKRLQLLKEMIPGLRKVMTLYNPDNPAAQESVRLARDAARKLKVEMLERPVASVEALRATLATLQGREAEAYFYVSDSMVTSQMKQVIDKMAAIKMPTIFTEPQSLAMGALASYGQGYFDFGRLSAKQVHRVLLGADPANMPVEQLDKIHFGVNLKTAKALGLVIPQTVLLQANEVIQ